ncbi:MAG: 1,4-dihydroxy-6-naphthoate synthase [Bacteroidetes bacterium GWF2_38_335]|nr:MAG: 1,4-dihydroxy-6-naphthoate synthase [Bacteroidetes bacterium GWF2_38_335]OFY79901.1 MAG: 1,4-dihydroxy-6-naphthoate synthase [Bacteroidetes bacterium RIFOXYA12_FULL_38_20]HBS86357.1 1,4-dihydroxy-6-naphthoate synthase [Bacteroidales bacterium]
MKLQLAISPCPNDTYIFEALIHKRIDCGNLDFELQMADVEELNKRAGQGLPDVTKLSFFAYVFVSDRYRILNAGAALGKNNGPLLISRYKIYPDEVDDLKIAIPGFRTTANLLMSMAYPKAINKKEYLFSDIEEVVLDKEADAGLIIHESRFTFEKKGLRKIRDMGEYWEQEMKMPLPLGCIAVRRTISDDLAGNIDGMVRNSILYAKKNPSVVADFIRKNAQELDDEVIEKHIGLYVNEYSENLGETGKKAIQTLFEKAYQHKLTDHIPEDVFVK